MRRSVMTLSLPADLERIVAAEIATGRYSSAEEVVREALVALEERDGNRSPELEAFDKELRRRLARMDAGDLVDGADARSRLARRAHERRGRPA
jgi:antitoxin ParD1/3/4